MEEIIIRLFDMLPVVFVLAYISGMIVIFGYFLRTGINQNAPICIDYTRIEIFIILLYIVFWPLAMLCFVFRKPEF